MLGVELVCWVTMQYTHSFVVYKRSLSPYKSRLEFWHCNKSCMVFYSADKSMHEFQSCKKPVPFLICSLTSLRKWFHWNLLTQATWGKVWVPQNWNHHTTIRTTTKIPHFVTPAIFGKFRFNSLSSLGFCVDPHKSKYDYWQ